MNRIRKIFGWLWRTKERSIFVITVLVLAYRIFEVFQTTDDSGEPIPQRPSENITRLSPPPPEAPPDVPPLPPPVSPQPLTQNDPFVFQPKSNAAAVEGDDSVGIRLLNIRSFGDGYVVQIETESSVRWYSVGDAFESYELISVDPDDESAEVFDESTNQRQYIYLEE